MLAFTPEVESVLRWFDTTHEVEVIGMSGLVRWRRTGLPGPGNIGEQDARLMAAIDFVRLIHDELVRPKTKTTHE